MDLSITKFVEALKEKIREYDALLARKKRIRRAIEELEAIIRKREEISQSYFKAKNLAKEQSASLTEKTVEDDAEEIRARRLRLSISECEKKITYYQAELQRFGLTTHEQIDEVYPSVVLGK